jgi:hypothetical protein
LRFKLFMGFVVEVAFRNLLQGRRSFCLSKPQRPLAFDLNWLKEFFWQFIKILEQPSLEAFDTQVGFPNRLGDIRRSFEILIGLAEELLEVSDRRVFDHSEESGPVSEYIRRHRKSRAKLLQREAEC